MKCIGTKLTRILAAAAIGASVALAGPTARADDDIAEAQAIARVANLITPERANEIALAKKPGVVTDFDLDRKRKSWVYEIEIVDAQGTEWEVEIDGATGNVLRVKRDWF